MANRYKLIGLRPNDRDQRVMAFLAEARPGESPTDIFRRSIRAQARADGLSDPELLHFEPEKLGRPKKISEPKQSTTKGLASTQRRKARSRPKK